MFRFWRACSPARVAQSTAAQTALMELSKAELEPFLAATGTAGMLRKEGNLQVYEGEAELRASLPGWQARAEHGIEFRHLTAEEMAAIQPGLAPRFTHGTFTPGLVLDRRPHALHPGAGRAVPRRRRGDRAGGGHGAPPGRGRRRG